VPKCSILVFVFASYPLHLSWVSNKGATVSQVIFPVSPTKKSKIFKGGIVQTTFDHQPKSTVGTDNRWGREYDANRCFYYYLIQERILSI